MRASLASSDSAIVANALIEAGQWLGVTQDQLAQVIGVSRATIARIKKSAGNRRDEAALSPNSKAFELALVFIRVYRSLYSIVGGNPQAMKHWMATPNRHLGNEEPLELIQTALGLSRVIWYLDAMRGKI